MDDNDRIAQFENMAQADPENEMAHFSLGGAYAKAGRHEDAAAAYAKCVEVNPDMSKAYQLGAEALEASGKKDEAVALATKGYEIAAGLGDLMPRNAMGELLERNGAPVPQLEDGKGNEPIPEGSFICAQSGRLGTQMEAPPFKGPIGAWIQEHISQETWAQWIGQGTKVINELRLDLSRDEDAETYDRYMHEFLGLDDEKIAEIRLAAAAR